MVIILILPYPQLKLEINGTEGVSLKGVNLEKLLASSYLKIWNPDLVSHILPKLPFGGVDCITEHAITYLKIS